MKISRLRTLVKNNKLSSKMPGINRLKNRPTKGNKAKNKSKHPRASVRKLLSVMLPIR